MLSEKYHEDGFWWFPSEPDKKYPGELKFDVEERISLVLTDVTNRPFIDHIRNNVPIVYGLVSSGKAVTLLDCFDYGSSWSSSGISKRRLSPEVGLIGCHIPVDNQLFRAAYFSLSLAGKWLRNSGINIDHKESFGNIDIKYREQSPIEVKVGEEFNLNIARHLSSVPGSWFDAEEIKLEEKVTFEVRPFEPKQLGFFVQTISSLRDFLTIACDSICETTEISLECNFLDERYKDRERFPLTHLLIAQPKYTSTRERADSRDFLFVYPDIKDNINAVLNKWFEVQDKIRIVKDLYISALYSPFSYIETRFLSLAQATEVFHRQFYTGKYFEKDVFEKRVRNPLVEAIDAGLELEYKESIKRGISYFNEFSLSKRLKEITREYEDVLSWYSGDIKKTVKGIVDARNYLTHYAGKKQEDDFFEKVLKYTDFLKLILDISFIKTFGIEMSQISDLIKRNHQYISRFRYRDHKI